MKYALLSLVTLSALAMFAPLTVHAQDDVKEDVKQDPETLSETLEQDSKDRFTSVYEKVTEFSEGLSDQDNSHFRIIYDAHNVLRVVNEVQGQVGEAVSQCGEVNPDMKSAMDERYTAWNEAITQTLDTAQANIDNMIVAQDYASKKDYKNLFKFIDKRRAEQGGAVHKQPVTSPEACEYLRAKMDETEENLISLLETTLVALPQQLLLETAPETEAE